MTCNRCRRPLTQGGPVNHTATCVYPGTGVCLVIEKARDEGWMRGYACALAELLRLHRNYDQVADCLHAVGGYDALAVAGADERDLEWLRKVQHG